MNRDAAYAPVRIEDLATLPPYEGRLELVRGVVVREPLPGRFLLPVLDLFEF